MVACDNFRYLVMRHYKIALYREGAEWRAYWREDLDFIADAVVTFAASNVRHAKQLAKQWAEEHLTPSSL